MALPMQHQEKPLPELKLMTLKQWLSWIPDGIKCRPPEYFDWVFGCDVDMVVDDFNPAFEAYINRSLANSGSHRRLNLRALSTYFAAYDPRAHLKRHEEGRYLREFVQRGYREVPFIPGAPEAILELRKFGLRARFLTATPGFLDVSSDHGNRVGAGDAQAARLDKFSAAGLIDSAEDMDFVDAGHKADRMVNRVPVMPLGIDDDVSTLAGLVSKYGIAALGIRNEWTPYNHGWEKTAGGLIWFANLAEAVPFIKEYFLVLDYLGLMVPRL